MTEYITKLAQLEHDRDGALASVDPDYAPRGQGHADENTRYTNTSRTIKLECTEDDCDDYAFFMGVEFDSFELTDEQMGAFVAWLAEEEMLHVDPHADSVWDAITSAFGEEGAVAVADDTLARLQVTLVTSACGAKCKVAIDGVALTLATLGMSEAETAARDHPQRALADDIIRTCVRACEVMVCG